MRTSVSGGVGPSRRRLHQAEPLCDTFTYEEGDLERIETEDGLDVRFRLRVLADLLICQLCGGFFRDASTIRECLHTYCRSCILYFYQLGGRCCPICKEPFVGSNIHDAIQSDVTIQNLVDKMLPCLQVQDRDERAVLHAFLGLPEPADETSQTGESSSSFAPTLTAHTADGELQPSSQRTGALRRPVMGAGWDASQEFYQKVLQSSAFTMEMVSMKISLEPASLRLPDLPRPFIRTSPKMQIAHLSRYLAGKLRLCDEDFNLLEIIYQGQVLPKSHSLEFVCRSRRMDPCKGVYSLQYDVRGDYTPLTPHELEVWELQNRKAVERGTTSSDAISRSGSAMAEGCEDTASVSQGLSQ